MGYVAIATNRSTLVLIRIQDSDPGILTEFLPQRDRANLQEFCVISCFSGGLRSQSACSFVYVGLSGFIRLRVILMGVRV